jgi:GTP-binding protein
MADSKPQSKIGKGLWKLPCEFIRGASSVDSLPPVQYPEVAFCGRSNVGKSSLLNALTKRKALARTSKTPGCTREVNFFLLAEKIMLADVPGYGYARAGRAEVAGWNQLIKDYLRGRPNLRRVFLLIDARHDVKPSDIDIMSMLDQSAVSYQIVLTKVDKQSRQNLDKLKIDIANLGDKHPALHPDILETSSRDGVGLDSVRITISSFLKKGEG